LNFWEQCLAIGSYLAGHPVLSLLLLTAPLLVFSRWKNVYPNRAFVNWLLLPVFLSFLLVLKKDALPLIIVVDLVILIVAIADLFSLPRSSAFDI